MGVFAVSCEGTAFKNYISFLFVSKIFQFQNNQDNKNDTWKIKTDFHETQRNEEIIQNNQGYSAVLGNCCWEIKGRNRQRQQFNVGTRNQRPRFAYIKSVRAANRC